MDDVIKALAKHKNAALHMKEVIKSHEKETIKVQRPYNFHAKSKWQVRVRFRVGEGVNLKSGCREERIRKWA